MLNDASCDKIGSSKEVIPVSTLESTISMLENMAPADVEVIYTMTKALFDKQASPFQPLSREQILRDLAESRQQIQAGQYSDAKDALQALRSKYGL